MLQVEHERAHALGVPGGADHVALPYPALRHEQQIPAQRSREGLSSLSHLSFEAYQDICRALTKSGSTVQSVSPVEKAMYRAGDLKHVRFNACHSCMVCVTCNQHCIRLGNMCNNLTCRSCSCMA